MSSDMADQMLLSDVNIWNINKKSIECMAIRIPKSDLILYDACYNSDIDTIKNHNNDININNIQNMFTITCRGLKDDEQILKYLLDLNLGIDIRHNNDQAFILACLYEKLNVIKYLCELCNKYTYDDTNFKFDIIGRNLDNEYLTFCNNFQITRTIHMFTGRCKYCESPDKNDLILCRCTFGMDILKSPAANAVLYDGYENEYCIGQIMHKKCAFYCYQNRESKCAYTDYMSNEHTCQRSINWSTCQDLLICMEFDKNYIEAIKLIKKKEYSKALNKLNISQTLYVKTEVINDSRCVVCLTNKSENDNVLINFNCGHSNHFMHLECAIIWYIEREKSCIICKTPFVWSDCKKIETNDVNPEIQDEMDSYMS